MREILFKAKRKDNGEWVEGQLFKTNLLTFIFPEVTNGSFDGKAMKFINPCYYVDSETVCQYTGLTEKNGEKKWEKDIFEDAGELYVIEYDEDDLKWIAVGAFGSDAIDLGEFRPEEINVFGNVFDDPELLEEGSR